LRNPYICGGWVAGPHFYGRQKLVQQIVNARFDTLYILGGRRSGKTSLLHRVEEVRVEQGSPCLFLDLQATGRTIDGLFQVLRAELYNKAGHWEHLFSPELLAAPDLLALADGLLALVEVEGMELLLLLDEADVLVDMANSFPDDLACLWQLGRECSVLHIVLAASRVLWRMGQVLSSRLSCGLPNDCQLRYLRPLDDSAARALIKQDNSRSPVRVSVPLTEQIKEATGCQPYLLQLLCQRLYQPDHSLRPPAESDLDVDELLASLFLADYQNLGGGERDLLWLVVDRPGQDLSTLRGAAGLEADNLATCLRWLESLGYVRRRRNRFFVTNAFLASWLLASREELEDVACRDAECGTASLSESQFLPCTR